ncbi:oligosaccharide flippase family protein [Candidatus Woesebacteria bacterium]|nr:oligosaccharide flippase family protein [Candidatus Woesebacteria bacterium]
MLSRLLTFIKEPTSANVIINTLGNYVNIFFVALFALLLVRFMSPEQYGVLSVLLGIAYVLANVLEFGTTATIYSVIPPLYEKKSFQLYRFIKSTFYYQSLFSFIIIIILFITFPYLDKVFFKTGAARWELYLTAISVLLLIWQNFFTNILFATKKFLKANLYINIANLIKTIIIFYLNYTGFISVGIVMFVFGILGPIIFFLLILIRNRSLIPHFHIAEVHKEDFKFGYTMTYFAASQFYNLGLRMDLFLLSFFGLRQEVGYYGLAQKIILTIIASIVSITQVLSPRFASIQSKEDVKKEIKQAFYFLLLPTAIFIALYLTPKAVFELVFTKKYAFTADISHSLTIAFVLNALGSIPMLYLLYTAKKPIYILLTNILFFVIISVGSYWLIPQKGVFGPPIAILCAFIVATVLQTAAMIYEYRKL